MKTFLELFSIHTYTTIFYGRSSWQLNVQVGFKIQYFYHKKMTKNYFLNCKFRNCGYIYGVEEEN